jgi:hypothetical protein
VIGQEGRGNRGAAKTTVRCRHGYRHTYTGTGTRVQAHGYRAVRTQCAQWLPATSRACTRCTSSWTLTWLPHPHPSETAVYPVPWMVLWSITVEATYPANTVDAPRNSVATDLNKTVQWGWLGD